MGDREPDLGEERDLGFPGGDRPGAFPGARVEDENDDDSPFLLGPSPPARDPGRLGGFGGRDLRFGELGNRPLVIEPGLQQHLPVTNVRDYGAAGDGTGDDTGAVREALNRTPDGGTIYFPAGEYPLQGLELFERRCLTLLGEGDCSLLRRAGADGTTGILHAIGCTDLTIRRLGFDANGLEPRDGDARETGILRFQRCIGVQIVQTVVDDSAPPDLPAYLGNFITDPWRTAFLFDHIEVDAAAPFDADTEQPNQDLLLIENRLAHLGVLVRNGRSVRIEANRFTFIGGYAVLVGGRGNGVASIDVTIRANEITEPLVGGIAVVASSSQVLERPVPGMISNITFSRVKVVGNTVVKSNREGLTPRTSPDGHGIFVGLAEEALPGDFVQNGDDDELNRHAVRDIVLRDIVVEGNHVEFARWSSWPARDAYGIVFACRVIEADWWYDHAADFRGGYGGGHLFTPAREAPVRGTPYFHPSLGFFHVVVSGNTVLGCRTAGIRAQRLNRSIVRGNLVQECTSGVHLELLAFSLVSGNHAVTTGDRPYKLALHSFSTLIGNFAAPSSVRFGGAYYYPETWPDARWTMTDPEPDAWFAYLTTIRTHAGDERSAE